MEATTELGVRDFAWVAGVLDMKGRMVRKNNKQRATPQLVLMVETKNFRVVNELAKLTGTNPELHEPRPLKEWMRKQCAEHCPEGHVHVSSRQDGYGWAMPTVGRWTITGAGAAVVLHSVLPYMRNDFGLDWRTDMIIEQAVLTGQGWGATQAQLLRLRALGWPMPPRFEARLDLLKVSGG